MSGRNQQTNRKTVAWLRPLSWSVVALLTLGQEVLAEPDPSTTPRTSTPREIHQTCWHPGRSANIGIAEPSCDTPMAKANRLPMHQMIETRPTLRMILNQHSLTNPGLPCHPGWYPAAMMARLGL